MQSAAVTVALAELLTGVADPGSDRQGHGFDVYGVHSYLFSSNLVSQGFHQAVHGICNELGGAEGVQMVVILLPANAADIRTRVKHCGDIQIGECRRHFLLVAPHLSRRSAYAMYAAI